MNPDVSVVLPVYNCARYVGHAIDSILGQTFEDFELIVIDDGSTDDTPSILRRYADPRMRVITQPNAGVAASANRGIAAARGRYVARMDADDLSLPERLARQVRYLDANPACGLVGTWAEIWRDDSPTDRTHRHPTDNATIRYELLLDNPFVQSSVMIRRTAIDTVGAYATDPLRQPPEDYELWSRIARRFEVANLPEILQVYREIEGSLSRSGPATFREQLVTICAENIALAAGVEPANRHAVNIAALVHGADDRIRGRLDFVAMRTLFAAAARRVAPDDEERFMRLAHERMAQLRRREWDRRYGQGRRRDLARVAYGLSLVTRTRSLGGTSR
jgi:glycosyltransferase involved in cell wall biosynthesis